MLSVCSPCANLIEVGKDLKWYKLHNEKAPTWVETSLPGTSWYFLAGQEKSSLKEDGWFVARWLVADASGPVNIEIYQSDCVSPTKSTHETHETHIVHLKKLLAQQ